MVKLVIGCVWFFVAFFFVALMDSFCLYLMGFSFLRLFL